MKPSGTNQHLRVLIIEDSESDAALVERELIKAGYEVDLHRVDAEAGMKQALQRCDWDLIVADYALPGFDASGALRVLRASGRDIPLIVVSGQIGEDCAVGLMKEGAHDYVLKSNLARLGPAVVRELKEAQGRRDRRLAELALRDSEARYRAIVECNTNMICRFLQDGRLTFVNSAYCEYFGKTKEELIGRTFTLLVPDEDQPALHSLMEALHLQHSPCTLEHRVWDALGRLRWNQWTNSAILDDRGRLLEFQAVGRDITEQKHAENEMRRLTGELLRLQDEERRRIARELHDTTAQKISALSLNLNYVQAHAETLTPKAAASLTDALSLVDSCSQEIRTLSYLLHPPELDLLGLGGAIRDFAKGFSRRSGIEVNLEVSPDFERLEEDVETALFRIVQESLTNVHRHSGSACAWIRLWREENGVGLEVSDRGRGFSAVPELVAEGANRDFTMGVGIAGMRERMKRLQGQLDVASGPTGTTVRANVPIR